MRAFEEKLVYSAGSHMVVGLRREKVFKFEWHYHQAYEITLILKGKGQRFVGDSIESYQKGDLVFIPPNLPHTWKSANGSEENEAIYIQFGKSFLGAGTFEAEDFRDLQPLMFSSQGFKIKGDNLIESFFKACLEARGTERVLSLLTLLKNLSVLEKNGLSSQHFQPERDEQSREAMDVLMGIVTSNSKLRVPQIAEKLNMSESSFRRFIKKTTGRSFIDFNNMIQISEVSRLLMESRLSISEVAMECGYRNLSHFNRKFKEYRKVTPKEFRRSFDLR